MDSATAGKAEFAELLRRNQTQLFGYIYSLVRDLDDADDLFQQTSLVLWDKYEQFDPTRSFVGWACGVARYEVLNFPAGSESKPALLQRRAEFGSYRIPRITRRGTAGSPPRRIGRLPEEIAR